MASRINTLCALLAAFLSAAALSAEPPPTDELKPTLAPRCGLPFRDNAVLQQGIPLPVWGHTLPAAAVTVTFEGQTKTAVADADGAWRVTLDPLTAVKLSSVNDSPEGQTMVVTCEKDGTKAVHEIRNLLVGEVWLCAGQSNMAGKMGTGTSRHFPADSIAQADYPALRQMLSPADGPWLVCSPETAPTFKKVCFFFAREVQREILVPVGIINASVGGSRIETWLNEEPSGAGKNYQSKVSPLVGYGLRGMVWYQGESNAKDGRDYLPKLRSLILGWRKVWGQGEFPCYFVQLPGIGTSPTDNPAGGDGRAEIRQAYFEALALKNTGMAVTLDIGDVREHPPNKYDTGIRLARLALHHDYGLKELVPSGPLYESHKIEGKNVRIKFKHAQNGLMLAEKTGFLPPVESADAKLGWLAIQGSDGAWHWAESRIDGSDLIVSSSKVERPAAVRYAYTNHPTGPLLYNKDGIPAGPFSTCGYDPGK